MVCILAILNGILFICCMISCFLQCHKRLSSQNLASTTTISNDKSQQVDPNKSFRVSRNDHDLQQETAPKSVSIATIVNDTNRNTNNTNNDHDNNHNNGPQNYDEGSLNSSIKVLFKDSIELQELRPPAAK